jgi:hypothetical protein
MTQTDQPTAEPNYGHLGMRLGVEYCARIAADALAHARNVLDGPLDTDEPDREDEDAPSLPDQILGILSAGLTPERTATAIRDLFVDHHAALIYIADAAVAYVNAPDGTAEAYDTYEALEEAVQTIHNATVRRPAGAVA